MATLNATTLFLAATTLYAICGVAYVCMKDPKVILQGYNIVLELERVLISKFYGTQKAYLLKNKIANDSGPLLILGTLFDGFAPFFMTFVAIIFNYDAAYYLMEQYLLDDPIFRSLAEIVGTLLLRAFILLPFMMESFRSSTVFIMDVFIGADSIVTVIQIFEEKVDKLNMANELYILLALLYKVFKDLFELFLYFILTIPFWIIVACMWVNVKGFGKVHVSIQICSL